MKNSFFDISLKRFHPLWLILGAVIGRAWGLMAGMNFASWYLAEPSAVLGWQILMAIVCALFASFLMTSRASIIVKWTTLGLGFGFAAAFYGEELWIAAQDGRSRSGLAGLTFGEGCVFEWLLMHVAWFGAIIGLTLGLIITKNRRKAQSTVETPPVDEPSGKDLESEAV